MINCLAIQKDNQKSIPMIQALMGLFDEIIASDDNLANSSGVLDFSEYLFVVPAKESGRLLREHLADKYHERGGVLSLNCVQVEYFLYDENHKKTLNKREILELWNKILLNADEDLTPSIFKNNALSSNINNISWRLNMCKTLHDLRKEIALEQGITVAEFSKIAKDRLDNESPIYAELSEKIIDYLLLEAEFIKQKGENYWDEADIILHNIKKNYLLDKSIKKIILLDCCELKKSVIVALNNLENIPIELYLNVAPADLKYFDAYGRAIPNKIKNVQIDIDFEKQLRVYSKPSKMAEKIADLLSNSANLPSCIGVVDKEIIPYLEFLLKSGIKRYMGSKNEKFSVYIPKSYKLSEMIWTRLFLQLLNFKKEYISFEEFAILLRNGIFSSFLVKYLNIENYFDLLKKVDKLQKNHILTELYNIKKLENLDSDEYFELSKILNYIEELSIKIKESDNIIATCWEILETIGSNLEVQNSNIDLYISQLELDSLKGLVADVIDVEDKLLQIELFQFLLKDLKIEPKGDNESAIDFTGFLEVLWREDENILLAGFNEEMFNCSESNNMFIPEKIRELFNFTCQKDRHATDIYHFYSLNKAHMVSILVGKKSNGGDILRPAKLLFYQSDDNLVKSSSKFFLNKLDENITTPLHENYMKYRVDFKDVKLVPVSASMVKSYLSCPFNFYLDKFLHVKELNDRNLELDAMQIGTIIHEVLEKFAKLPNLKSFKEIEIRQYLFDCFEQLITRKYIGNSKNSLLDIQKANMKQILQNFANIQYTYMQGKDSYQILSAEKKFEFKCKDFFHLDSSFDELIFKGSIDRIDRYIENGKVIYEIIDYKTSNTAKSPRETHIKELKNRDEDDNFIYELPENNVVKSKNAYYKFLDVQLPLYLAVLKSNVLNIIDLEEDYECRVKYCNINTRLNDCGYVDFIDCNNFIEDVLVLTKDVVEKIFIKQEFWPPNLKQTYPPDYMKILGNLDENSFEVVSQNGRDGK